MRLDLSKILLVLIFLFFVGVTSYASDGKHKSISDLGLAIEKSVKTSSVKNQDKTNACWSFSTISLFESEMMRKGKEELDLSEMYIVYYSYLNKAKKYIRLHGAMRFSGGGLSNDVLDVIKEYGCVPDDVYPGKKTMEGEFAHFRLEITLKEYLDSILLDEKNLVPNNWELGFCQILDENIGEIPKEFMYEGELHTPASFIEKIDVKAEDYIHFSSFMHHPYYKDFALEVPDNWSWGKVVNLPLDELVTVAESALNDGYSLTWAADISEEGFSFKDGVATLPRDLYHNTISRAKKYDVKDSKPKKHSLFNEIEVSDSLRQYAFDSYLTTDDHGMHIVGSASSHNGQKFFIVKNSWGEDNKLNGYLYVSEAYFKYKTISLMVHKDAIPKEIFQRIKN